MTTVTVDDFIYSYISGNIQTNGDILLVDGVGADDIYACIFGNLSITVRLWMMW